MSKTKAPVVVATGKGDLMGPIQKIASELATLRVRARAAQSAARKSAARKKAGRKKR